MGILEHFPVVLAVCTPGSTLAVRAGSRAMCTTLLLLPMLLHFSESISFIRA